MTTNIGNVKLESTILGQYPDALTAESEGFFPTGDFLGSSPVYVQDTPAGLQLYRRIQYRDGSFSLDQV